MLRSGRQLSWTASPTPVIRFCSSLSSQQVFHALRRTAQAELAFPRSKEKVGFSICTGPLTKPAWERPGAWVRHRPRLLTPTIATISLLHLGEQFFFPALTFIE